MKRIKTWLTTIATLLCSITVNAHDFEVGGIYYNILSATDKTVEVTYRGSSSDAYSDEYFYHETIPSTVTYGGITYTVTAIGEQAFLSCKEVTGVTIPNTVTNIGYRAFYHCTNLSDVTLPSSIKTIDGYAFGYCESLTTITIPENVTTIREDAFCGCTNLAKFIFNATNMISTVGESESGQYVSSIFYDCNKLTTITIGSNVKKIPAYAFWQCSKITKITIPENVTSIGDEAFGMCSSLREVTFNAKNCTSAGSSDYPTFESCNSLTTIKIGENVKCIPRNAFYGCAKITSITIPNSVTSFGACAFGKCTGLKSITLPNTLTTIAPGMFVGCASLSSVTIPNTVTEISSAAFSGCTALTEITIPNSVKYIRNSVFNGCTSLTEIVIPESITEIEALVFNGCTGLTNVTIPNTVTEIGDNAFSDCSKLTEISISNSVTKIGSRAFKNCTSLTNINIPNTITSLPEVFRGCTSLENITIPNSVTSLSYTFYDCTSLTDIVIPNSVTNIGDCTFRGCTNLKSVTIPNSVTSIGWAAFADCTSLTSITIPESVEEFESTVFHNCRALIEVICKKSTPVTVGTNEFYGVPFTSATLYVPKGSKSAYASATGWSKFQDIVEYSIIPEYTITYMVDGEVYYSETIKRDAEIPTIDVPTKEGHTFKGWENMPSTMPDEDVTVNAVFTPNNYTVTFKAYGEIVSSEALAYGTAIAVPNAPEIEDYAFVEWVGLLETVPAYNVEFVAVYEQVGIHLVDGVNSFVQNEVVSFNRIRYTRNFNNTNWQALYVPFEIPVTEEFLADFEVAYINDARQYDHDEDGKKDETIIEAFKIKTGTLEPNYPYLIRAREVGEKAISVTDATLYAAEENYIDCSSVFETYTFTGSYKRMSSDELSGYYSLSGGIWRPIAEGASLGAFRIYLKVDSRNGNTAPARAIRMRVIGDDTDDDATSIDVMESTDDRLQTTVIYDLHGRRIENTENLKGVYVVNGRKVAF